MKPQSNTLEAERLYNKIQFTMDTKVKTVVTFGSSTFNISEPRDYFINPGCFGDDVAKWLIERLRCKGYQAADTPGQEDFGWFFTFTVSGIEHCFVISYRPGNDYSEDVWIGWLERSRRLVASLLGARNNGIYLEAVEAIHGVLLDSPDIHDLRWYFQSDFDGGLEDKWSASPTSLESAS